jgi:hypothetical protein
MKTLSKPMTAGQPAARHRLPLTPSSPFKDLQPARTQARTQDRTAGNAASPDQTPVPNLGAKLWRPGPGDQPWCPALVEVNGIEPSTSCLQSRRSPN